MGHYLFRALCHERTRADSKPFAGGKIGRRASLYLREEQRGYASQNLKMGLQNGGGGTSFFWLHP